MVYRVDVLTDLLRFTENPCVMELNVFELNTANETYLARLNVLLCQLSSSPRCLSLAALEAIVHSPNSHLFVVEADGVVAGMLTLGDYLTPTGRKMWIEDVVVDTAMRGRSLGRILVEYAIGYARKNGPLSLMLTSRPSRVAANELYRSCGFVFKETNNYRMDIPEGEL